MGDDLIDWLKTYSAELMRLARGVSNLGKPESDNNYGREAKRILEAADRIYALEGKLEECEKDNEALRTKLGTIRELDEIWSATDSPAQLQAVLTEMGEVAWSVTEMAP